MNEKFLPIGTVVLLKEAEKKLMITGFCTYVDDEQKTMYDYCGCLYPEGVLSSDQVAIFNHDQIEKIFHLGYSDEEEKNFKIRLNEVLIETSSNQSNVELPNLNNETENDSDIETL